MGRPRKCKFVSRRHPNCIVEWYDSVEQNTNNSTPYQEILEDCGLAPGIPYSQNKHGLWDLPNKLKEAAPEEAASLAILEFDPFSPKNKAQVHLTKPGGHSKSFQSANYKSIIKADCAEQAEASSTKSTGLPRNSSRKTSWHKTRNPSRKTSDKTSGNASKEKEHPDRAYFIVAREKELLKSRYYELPLFCLDHKDQARQQKARWFEHLKEVDQDQESCVDYECESQDQARLDQLLNAPIELNLDEYELKPDRLRRKHTNKKSPVVEVFEENDEFSDVYEEVDDICVIEHCDEDDEDADWIILEQFEIASES